MTLVPLPGATDAELVVKVGNSVIQGLRAASQPPAWPDTREALLDLHAILREWLERSTATTRYAEAVIRERRSATYTRVSSTPVDAGSTNVGVAFVRENTRDTRRVLQGKIPPLGRLRGSTRRRASRRGLRTILAAYCPALLEQFESATTARLNWVIAYREDFDRWFVDRTDAQIAELMSSMGSTHAALAEAEQQLGEFIRTNFPLPGTTPRS